MNKPIIMIAGVHGFVGTRAAAYFKDAIAVPSELLRAKDERLADFVKMHSPSYVINAAAISDIGVCEMDHEASYQANVILPTVFAKTCSDIGAKLCSFSSDQVYTGCQNEGPYSESDVLPTPANVYARHKLEAENRVLDIFPDAVLLRATWMYDMPMYANGGLGNANRGNFLVNTVNSILYGKELAFSSVEYRGITYVRQVVSLLEDVYRLPGGVYNYGSENPLNMFDTAKALLETLGINAEVKDTKNQKHNLWMNCSKLKENGICFDTTAEGFKRMAKDYGICKK